jgi:hypothetical protein
MQKLSQIFQLDGDLDVLENRLLSLCLLVLLSGGNLFFYPLHAFLFLLGFLLLLHHLVIALIDGVFVAHDFWEDELVADVCQGFQVTNTLDDVLNVSGVQEEDKLFAVSV